jgi:hypothetical protein
VSCGTNWRPQQQQRQQWLQFEGAWRACTQKDWAVCVGLACALPMSRGQQVCCIFGSIL